MGESDRVRGGPQGWVMGDTGPCRASINSGKWDEARTQKRRSKWEGSKASETIWAADPSSETKNLGKQFRGFFPGRRGISECEQASASAGAQGGRPVIQVWGGGVGGGITGCFCSITLLSQVLFYIIYYILSLRRLWEPFSSSPFKPSLCSLNLRAMSFHPEQLPPWAAAASRSALLAKFSI